MTSHSRVVAREVSGVDGLEDSQWLGLLGERNLQADGRTVAPSFQERAPIREVIPGFRFGHTEFQASGTK